MRGIWAAFAIMFILVFALAGPATATFINLSGSEANLQEILDDMTVGGSSSVNVTTDQVPFDEIWAVTASGGSVATIITELAGYAGTNSFGVYDLANPGNKVELFAGSDGSGDQALLSILADGSVNVNFVDTGVNFAGNLFGFYLDVPQAGATWYSQVALNNGQDHMVAYQGKGDLVQLPSVADPQFAQGVWTSNEYVLGWEDLSSSQWDQDYNDFVLMVESVVPTPEPGTVFLLGGGLLGLVAYGRRKMKKQGRMMLA